MNRRATIAAAVGLHARPAALLASAAAGQPAAVTIAKVTDDRPGDPVDASSVLGLMTLGARQGEQVELSSESAEALDELVALLERDLDEEPAAT
ncbi:MAG: HPr family phosphocarrier protein [Saccharopolyspora sp.]|uniref:HPr family phosphocarrier protein n=1 Tax=Saccharopolyspora TaxID=1835 RepID=UPI00190C44A2|nr:MULTISPECIES: HPr family phosphocarrier protein [unclassified Saccharopolyspora]MBK0867690.1 HPr family phosphocarrier protein [Saccharopolyspora sp. HNM0986]MBQ6643334.1 HPr family phosphocarrier protein [Saccharopolyspora sp.]